MPASSLHHTRRAHAAGLRVHALATVAAAACSVLVPAAAAAQAPSSSSPRAVVARAVQAMGGEQALRGLATTTVDFHTVTFGLGQEETPESPARATVAYGRTVTDWSGGRRAVSQEVRPVAGAATRQRFVAAAGIGLTETDGRQAAGAPAQVAGTERAMRLAPERLLLAALDAPASLRALPPRQWRGELADGLRYAAGADTVSLFFDRPTGLLAVAEVLADDPVLGDRRTATWYTRWQEAGGVKLPRQIDAEVNGRLVSHTVITALAANQPADAALFTIPDSIASRAQRAAPAAAGPATAPAVQLQQLAPGVWRVEGGTHFSLVVEQPRQLIVVEAPLNAARSRAVLDTLRARFPGKPVATLVNTHHHWDHSGGVRAYMAAGIPVVAHARNVAFLRRVGLAAKTVAPDALSRLRRVPAVRGMTDTLLLGAGDGRVVLYALPTAHAEGLLAAYVPSARLLFVSDVLTPGPTLAPAGSAELVAMARARGITIERVAGGHGGVANWADVERAAGR